MWATAIELGIPALLIFALWRIWPKEAESQGPAAAPGPDHCQEKPQDHDHQP